MTEGIDRHVRELYGDHKLTATAAAAILFLEGYASLSIEVLALRRMVPWTGSPVPVTAILLAAYLAALAAGYYRGGRAALDRTGARMRLGKRLACAAVLSAIWLGDVGPYLVFELLPLPRLVQVALYSTLGIGPIGWLLAESILLVHVCRPSGLPTAQAGSTFALSTAGNVGGALLTALVVMATLGTAAAVIIIVAMLAGAALVAAPGSMKVGAASACALLPLHGAWYEATEYVARTAYADYRIADLGDERVMTVNRQLASRDTPDGEAWPYIEMIEAGLCEDPGQRVLVLGAAGRTLGRGRDCGLDVTFVDVDGRQGRISGALLHGAPGGPLVTADARAFLQDTETVWDAIVADAYTHAGGVPEHLITVEFFRTARTRLGPGGALYVNLVTRDGNLAFRTRADRTIRSVFGNCSTRSSRVHEGFGWKSVFTSTDNTVYRCQRSPYDGERVIYSDALPRSHFDIRLPR